MANTSMMMPGGARKFQNSEEITMNPMNLVTHHGTSSLRNDSQRTTASAVYYPQVRKKKMMKKNNMRIFIFPVLLLL